VWVEAHTYKQVSQWLRTKRSKNREWRADSVSRFLNDKVVKKQKSAHWKQPTANAEKGEEVSGSYNDGSEHDADTTMMAVDDAGHHATITGTTAHSASTRWCALIDLPYFDIVRCVPIDAMHNLLLGLCKHIMSILTGHHDKLTASSISDGLPVQQPCESAAVPAAAAMGAKKQKLAGGAAHSSAAAAAAAAAAGEKLSVKPAGALLWKDLESLQRSVSSCDTPRDIGRMTSRLDSLDSIKAVEWLNIFATFIVPFVRSRMPGHTQLRGEHLTLLTRVANIVTLSTSYFTTPQMIDELHGELVQVMLDVERLSPQTSSYISPNMHLSLHLAAQLRDHGPATSWWTFPYERLMGLTANIPFRPGRSSVDTAKRALALLEITARATPPLEEKSCFGRFGIRLPDGPGFKHGVRRTDSGGRTHWYQFVGVKGTEAARLLHLFRLAGVDYTVQGCEPYPGLLFNSGQLFRPRGGRTRSVLLSGGANDADMHDAGERLLTPSAFYKQLWEARQKLTAIHTLSHVRRCLLAHHLTTRWREVRAAYDAAIAAAHTREQHSVLRDEQSSFDTADTNRTHVFAALLAASVDASWIMAPAAYQSVLHWYQQQCGGLDAWDRVDVYDKLFYAGEEFGSSIVSDGQNALISANFITGDTPSRWYGRVSYYVRHTFAGKAHDFAVARWFDFADVRRLDVPTEQLRKGGPVQQSLHDYPIVQAKELAKDIRDMVPVHRITGRWISMRPEGAAAAHYQMVCPIRSRLHG